MSLKSVSKSALRAVFRPLEKALRKRITRIVDEKFRDLPDPGASVAWLHDNELTKSFDGMRKIIRHLELQIEDLRVSQYFAKSEALIASRVVQLKSRSGAVFALAGERDDLSIIGAVEHADGQYEQHVVAAISELIEGTAVCLDIGANIGAMALQLSDLAPTGRVHCFEPSPTNFEFLQKNVTANRISNVQCWNLGLSNKEETLTLNYISGLAGCSFVLADSQKAPSELAGTVQQSIRCVRLDDWAEGAGLTKLDLIKLDAEGMEVAVLQGAEGIINRYRPILAVEFNPHTIEDFGNGGAEDFYNYIAARWRTVLVLGRDGQKTRITSWAQLDQITKNGPGWEDLICLPEH